MNNHNPKKSWGRLLPTLKPKALSFLLGMLDEVPETLGNPGAWYLEIRLPGM